MSARRRKGSRWAALSLVLPALVGCQSVIGEPAPPVVFNILTPVPDAEAETRAEAMGQGSIVGIVPVTVPDYLDTAQIVTRPTRNTLKRSDLHQWGAPLSENIANVLADNLGAMIPTQQVMVLPGSAAIRADYQVAVEVSKFELDADDLVTLVARWALLRDDGLTLVSLNRAVYTAPAAANDFDAIAASMSDTLARLSEDIAAAIRASVLHRGAGV